MFGVLVLTTAKLCRKLVNLWRVRFDHQKTRRRLAEVRRMGFAQRKPCKRLAKFGESVQKFVECILTIAMCVMMLE